MPSKQLTVPKKGIGDMFSDEEFNQILDAISAVDNSGASGYGIKTADIFSYGPVKTNEGFEWSEISTGKELVVDNAIVQQNATFLNESVFSGDNNTFTNDLKVQNPTHTARLTVDNVYAQTVTIDGKTITKSDTDIAIGGGNVVIGKDNNANSVTINCTTNFAHGDVTVQGGKFTAENSAEIGSTLKVDGATTLNDTLYVEKAVTLDSTLDVTDATNLKDTLTVTKATQLDDTLTTEGAVQFNDTLTTEGAVQFNNTLTAEGATQLNNTLTVSGNTQLDSQLNVGGNTTLGGDAVLNKTLTVTGVTVLKAATTLENTLTVDGKATFNDNVDIKKALNITETLTVVGDTTLSNVEVTDTATINDLIVDNTATLNNEVLLTGTTTSLNHLIVADTAARAATLLSEADTTGTGDHKKIVTDYLDVTDTISINSITTDTRDMLKDVLDPLFWRRILEIFKILDVQGVTINDLTNPDYSLTTSAGSIIDTTKFSIQASGPANINNALLSMQSDTTLYMLGPQVQSATESPRINVRDQLLAVWKSFKDFTTTNQYTQLSATNPLEFSITYKNTRYGSNTTTTGSVQECLTALASSITTLSERIAALENAA